MSFIRPEARAALWRWREVLLGALVAVLGAVLGLRYYGLVGWLGWVVAIAGLAFVGAGLQRARVRPRSGGAGVIELDEGQLRYLHAEDGAIVALPSVVRIEIESTGAGTARDDLFWRFYQNGGGAARIPASAVGAERLLDALAGFPGADYQKVIAASGARGAHVFVIWRKDAVGLH